MITRRQLLKTSAAVAAVSSFSITRARAAEVTFRFSSLTPETGYVHSKHLLPFKERVEAQSDGHIKIDLQPGGVFGRGPQLHELTETGVIDMGWTVQGYTSGRFPQSSVVELPFLYNTGADGTRLLMSMSEEGLFERDYGSVKVLGLYTHRPYALLTNGKEVRTLEDMAGLKVRTPSSIIGSTLEAFGATPVGLPVSEIAENLRRGVIDASVFPYEAIKLFGLTDQVRSLTDLRLAAPRFMIVMNRAKYEGLPDDLRAVIDNNSGMDFSVAIGAGLDVEEAAVKKRYNDGDTPVIELDETVRSKMADLAQPVVSDWVSASTDDGVDGAALLARAREILSQ